MTSNDVVDTAQALQVREASKLIERDLVMFGEILDLRAHEFRHTPQIRPHSRRAREPSRLLENRPTGSRKISATSRAPRSRRANGCGKIPAPSATPRISARKWKSESASALGSALCRRLASNSARPPRVLSQRPRAHRATLERSRSKFGISSAPKSAKRRAVQRRAARQFRHASQAQSCHLANRFGGALARLVRSNMLAAFENVALLARARHLPQLSGKNHPSAFHNSRDYMLSKMSAILGQICAFSRSA